MNAIPVSYGLGLASALFAVGFLGVLIRRNFLFMLVSVEIMLSSTALAFVTAGARWGHPDGQVMYIFILTLAAVEVSVGLALILLFQRHKRTLDSDRANTTRG
jgi:NADH-quinone oxidoreductase subunit K